MDKQWQLMLNSKEVAGRTGKYIILEFPNEEMIQSLHKGEKFEIIGKEKDEAVLCSADKTFAIKKVESSNSSLLLPPPLPSSSSLSIQTQITHHFELSLTTPKLNKLKEVLSSSTYPTPRPSNKQKNNNGNNSAEVGKKIDWTTQELREEIQASDFELRKGLIKIRAFKLDQKWRILSPAYERELLLLIVDCLISSSDLPYLPPSPDEDGNNDRDRDQHSSPLKKISVMKIKKLLKGDDMEIPPDQILRHLLKLYGSKPSPPPPHINNNNNNNIHGKEERMEIEGGKGDREGDGEEYFDIDDRRLSIAIAIDIFEKLKEANGEGNPSLPLPQFLDTWSMRSPNATAPSIDLLHGVAVRQFRGEDEYLQYFPNQNLSDDVGTRFDQLFSFKTKWQFDEIKPYLRDLVQTTSMSLEQLLLKYCRQSEGKDNVKFFSNRKL